MAAAAATAAATGSQHLMSTLLTERRAALSAGPTAPLSLAVAAVEEMRRPETRRPARLGQVGALLGGNGKIEIWLAVAQAPSRRG